MHFPITEARCKRIPMADRWSSAAVATSRQLAVQEFSRQRERSRAETEDLKNEELARAERIFSYRQVRLQNLIQDARGWITEKEAVGSERERRVLPARKGK